MRVRLICTVALSACALAATAMPVIRADFLKLNKIKPTSKVAQAQCSLCHLPNGNKLNPFGSDVKAAMKAAKSKKLTPEIIKAVGTKDSDKDGVKNAAEIKADTLPGDPKSKP
jgi:hypothetical protein